MRSLHEQLLDGPPLLSAGLASADPARLGEELAQLAEVGVRVAHVDVMDGSFGAPIATEVLPLELIPQPWLRDVHVMADDPARLVDEVVAAGADSVTVQIEAQNGLATLEPLTGVTRGIAICPDTPIDELARARGHVDLVLVLAIDPRKPERVDVEHVARRLVSARAVVGTRVRIGVDGRVDPTGASVYVDAGAQLVVAGRSLFAGDLDQRARAFMSALGGTRS